LSLFFEFAQSTEAFTEAVFVGTQETNKKHTPVERQKNI
jgi:hypothetical protein